jgi:hypothetical protein
MGFKFSKKKPIEKVEIEDENENEEPKTDLKIEL